MRTKRFSTILILAAILCAGCTGAGTKNLPWPAEVPYMYEDAVYSGAGSLVSIEQPDPKENYGVESTILCIDGATLDGVNAYIGQLVRAGYAPYQSGNATSVKMPAPDALMPGTWQGKDTERGVLVRVCLFGDDSGSNGVKYNLKLIFFGDGE